MHLRRPFALAAFAVLAATAAAAHPHVLVDARAELVFDQSGKMSAVRNVWQFDEPFTQFAIQGLDADDDGKLSDEELKPLAEVNVTSLKEFGFFTFLIDGQSEAEFLPPTEYWLEFYGGRLTLFFTLPLEKPMAVGERTILEVFDPEYFVAFNFVKDRPIALDSAPDGCRAIFTPPRELDSDTMSTLASIPMGQRNLPPDLVEAASVLANHFRVVCE